MRAILILITDKYLSLSCWMWNDYGTCSINFIQIMHNGLIKCTLLLFSCYTLFFCILTNASLYKLYGNYLVMRERKVKREREREKVGESNPFNTSHQSVSASNESSNHSLKLESQVSRIGLSRPPTGPLQSR